MPTLLLLYGFRFFFYSNEGNEPPHVHVTKGHAYGKVWLDPEIVVAYMVAFSTSEQKQIIEVIKGHSEEFKTKWNEYFG